MQQLNPHPGAVCKAGEAHRQGPCSKVNLWVCKDVSLMQAYPFSTGHHLARACHANPCKVLEDLLDLILARRLLRIHW